MQPFGSTDGVCKCRRYIPGTQSSSILHQINAQSSHHFKSLGLSQRSHHHLTLLLFHLTLIPGHKSYSDGESLPQLIS